jgi:hypothetical protein
MEYNSLYVYGVVDGKVNKTFEKLGIGQRGDAVYCIPFKDISLVVSDTPFQEYEPTEENTIVHEIVMQTLLKEELTIAPMRFCTILKGQADAMKLLHSAYPIFKKNILKVRNKSEFSVKMFLMIEELQKEISDSDTLMQKSKEIASELHEQLKEVADNVVLEEQITDDMIMNSSFLLSRDKIKQFYGVIQNFDKQFTDVVRIRISGPTVPYNFVSMPTKPR